MNPGCWPHVLRGVQHSEYATTFTQNYGESQKTFTLFSVVFINKVLDFYTNMHYTIFTINWRTTHV